jgi:uncharacterized lipoprotein YmbA
VHRWFLIFATTWLAGCAASGQTAQTPQPQPQPTAQLDDDTTCRAQGFAVGTSAYVQCRKQLDKQHLAENPDTWNSERENTVRALLGRPPSGWGGQGQ